MKHALLLSAHRLVQLALVVQQSLPHQSGHVVLVVRHCRLVPFHRVNPGVLVALQSHMSVDTHDNTYTSVSVFLSS